MSLWKGGFEASLNIQSKAGKATINLQVELEEALPVEKVSPSQFRRRERRAEARRLADETILSVSSQVSCKQVNA